MPFSPAAHFRFNSFQMRQRSASSSGWLRPVRVAGLFQRHFNFAHNAPGRRSTQHRLPSRMASSISWVTKSTSRGRSFHSFSSSSAAPGGSGHPGPGKARPSIKISGRVTRAGQWRPAGACPPKVRAEMAAKSPAPSAPAAQWPPTALRQRDAPRFQPRATLSRMFSQANRPASWKTIAQRGTDSQPTKVIDPALGWIRPAIKRSKVVFPHPLGPTMTQIHSGGR